MADVADVDVAGDVDALDAAGDVEDLDGAGDVAGLDAAGVVRAGELCALTNVNGASASIAMAINGTVDFMTILSLFRLNRGRPETTVPCLGGHIEVSAPRSACYFGEAIGPVLPASIHIPPRNSDPKRPFFYLCSAT